MLEAFKILNKQTPVYIQSLLTFKNNVYSFRFTNTVQISQVRYQVWYQFFPLHGSKTLDLSSAAL